MRFFFALAVAFLSSTPILHSATASDLYIQELHKKADAGDLDALYTLGLSYSTGQNVPKDPAKAVQFYRRVAEKGHADAQFQLGVAYQYGEGVPKNAAESLRWLKKAAAQNHSLAKTTIPVVALSFDSKSSPEETRAFFKEVASTELSKEDKYYAASHAGGPMVPERVAIIRQAAEAKFAKAQFRLGMLYEAGNGVEKNLEEARSWYQKAATTGHLQAKHNLANLYAAGEGGPADVEKAQKLYREAAEGGLAESQTALSCAYTPCAQQGCGLFGNDPTEAMKWARKAADQGYAPGMLRLGELYLQVPPVNVAEAKKWISKAAEKGDVPAKAALASLYVMGQGVPKDPQKAFELISEAAKTEDVNILTTLAYYHEAGIGVPKDLKRAFSLYRKAADAGGAEAMLQVGRYYGEGIGMPPDPSAARRYLKMAADRGVPTAWLSLGNLSWIAKGPNPEALRHFQRAAEAGVAYAQFTLASIYLGGLGVQPDLKTAVQWLTKAATQADPFAQQQLAFRYQFGLGVERNTKEADRWYAALRQNTEGSNFYAQLILGSILQEGRGLPQNMTEAGKLLQRAADVGVAQAISALGDRFYSGQGVARDTSKAKALYTQAAEDRVETALYMLALFAAHEGNRPEAVRRFKTLEELASRGNSTAMYLLGWRYEQGIDVSVDLAAARKWYEKAANYGSGDALESLGRFSLEGLAGQTDRAAARAHFQKAVLCCASPEAQRHNYRLAPDNERRSIELGWVKSLAEFGFSSAQLTLGRLYAEGTGYPQNAESAVHWFRKAAEQNHFLAQWELGRCYRDGRGVPKDAAQAKEWFQKAAEQGFHPAKLDLASLR